MIPRYEKKDISLIWEDQFKFERYLDVELAILKAQEGKNIPSGTADRIKEKATINPARVDEIEKVTKHDVIAFCTSVTENLESADAKYFHYGVTSSDVIDSALTLQLKSSLEVIMPKLEKTLKALYSRSLEMKDVATMGRSHGMFAEPMSFGQKLLGHYCEFYRRYLDYKAFMASELTIQFSGAVGNYAVLTPDNELKAADILGLKREEVSTQVIPRDRLAKLISIGGLLGSAIERLSVEIRHLHRSDVKELHEGFSKGQKGSSTMPHKKNPISGENLTGMARMLRSHVGVALDNIVLWHERDISHSSAERMILPDHFGILSYALDRLASTVENLVFHKDQIEEKVKENVTYLSSYYLHFLIKNTNFRREELYEVVQTAAFKASETGVHGDFAKSIKESMSKKGVTLELPELDFSGIKELYLKASDNVFKRALNSYPI